MEARGVIQETSARQEGRLHRESTRVHLERWWQRHLAWLGPIATGLSMATLASAIALVMMDIRTLPPIMFCAGLIAATDAGVAAYRRGARREGWLRAGVITGLFALMAAAVHFAVT